MKFAIVNGERKEATSGISGVCPNCEKPMIAKCGEKKIHHWSHKGRLECDIWWENETEWHRNWKAHFPTEWQEVIYKAENGEKHIADVSTNQGWIIEFQHSRIKPEECQSRESFYKKMIWIIDGTRRLRDKNKFFDEIEWVERINNKRDHLVLESHSDKCELLRDWSKSSAPVFFDFGEDLLWALLPKNKEGRSYIFGVDCNILINSLNPTPQLNYSFEMLFKEWTGSIEGHEFRMRRMKELEQKRWARGLL